MSTASNWDVVGVRTHGAEVDGAVPVVTAEELVVAIKQLVRAVGNAAVQPRGHFGQSIPKPVQNLTERMLLGPAPAGSALQLRAEIRRPVLPPEAGPEVAALFDEATYIPFSRRAVLLLADALRTLREFLDAATPLSGQQLNDAVVHGVSYELCTGLARALAAPGVSELEVTFDWAETLEPGADVVDRVVFATAEVDRLRAWARSLRESSVIGRQTVIGTLTDLHLGVGEERARVAMRALVGDRLRMVTMELATDEMFRLATAAFDARKQVQVTGRLERERGRAWRLTDMARFDHLDLLPFEG